MKITSILVSAMVLIAMVSFIFMPKSDFSENENRYLQKYPEFSVENIAEGSYTADLNSYLQDHFPLRDTFINIKTGFEKNILRKKLINNIYICDDFLIEKYNKPENMEKIINTFNNFSNSTNIKPDLMLVPTAITVYEDKLPMFAPKGGQLEDLKKYYSEVNMNCVDVYSNLKDSDNDYLYYRLDHHWTTKGAYLGYRAYCNSKGIAPVEEDKFKIKTVTDDFKGTIYSKLNDNSLKADKITVYNQNLDLTVKYDNEESNTIYAPEYLESKDKYSYFLNNIHSFVEITNNNIDTDKELVIAKDSYANCMIPFLVNHYKKIYVFDPRSYKGSISKFANEHNNVTDILVIYNMNTIDSDTGVNVIY